MHLNIDHIKSIFKRRKNHHHRHFHIDRPDNKILNILILGGGPVGLYAGYKLLKKGHNITVFEKRKEYTRHNIVGLSGSRELDILSTIPSEIMDELIKTSCLGSGDKAGRKKCYKEFFKNKPYESLQSRVIYIILNEMELALEKYFKLYEGNLIKPQNADAFEDIVLENNIISYRDNDDKMNIKLSEYDIIFINDGANSYYRKSYFKLTSYCEKVEKNIFYFGLTDDRKQLKISDKKEDLEVFAYGLLMIHEIQNKDRFNKFFKADAKMYDQAKYEKLFKSNKSINGIQVKNILFQNTDPNEEPKTLKSQNLLRMFISEKYIYISIMVNPRDIKEFYEANKTKELKYDNFCHQLKIYMNFALYYFDLSELIELDSDKNIYKIFPITFTFVKQSCTFNSINNNNNSERMQLVTLLGDAMTSGNFHAGIVLNKNLMSVNYIINLIDEYIDAYPKSHGKLDDSFLKLIFYQGNISNQQSMNYILKKSTDILINYDEIDKIDYQFDIKNIFGELGNIIFCKNCDSGNKLLCKNSVNYIKFLMDNSSNDVLQRVLKYLLILKNYNFGNILEPYINMKN